MKKNISLIITLILFGMNLLPFSVFAQENLNEAVVDNADVLSDEEESELSARLNIIRSTYNVDVSIYTDASLFSDTVQASADDIYDQFGYGMGDGDSGMMFYICPEVREYAFTTYGEAKDIFNQDAMIYMEKEGMLSYLKNDDYYNAFREYAGMCEEVLVMYENGESFEYKGSFTDRMIAYIVILGIALLIAFILMMIQKCRMVTVVEQNSAANYVKEGSLQLDYSRDIFLYSKLMKVAKPKDDSEHTSSSGRSHGGRSGRY